MKIYLNACDAVSDLHKKGFTNDFQLLGSGLLWVQEHIVIRRSKFAILEYHKVYESKNESCTVVVFGILALHLNVKGILINRYPGSSVTTPAVLVDPLKNLSADAVVNPRTFFKIRN